MKYFLTLFLCFTLTLTQADELKPLSVVWRRQDSILMTSYVALSAIDVYQTGRVLNRGGIEENPLYGKHPSADRLILSKTLMALAVYYLADYNANDRTAILIGANIMQGFVVVHNYTVLVDNMK